MKKIYKLFIIAIVALSCSAGANAQMFRFGVKAGLNVNKLHISDPADNFKSDNGCGFTGGLMVDFTVPIIGIGADISFMYSHMSGYITSEDKTSELFGEKISQSKNFLEIPINLKYKIGLPFVSPYILTGPSFAFNMGGSKIINTADVQYSWNFGAGLEIVKHLQIQAYYSLGINNILKDFKVAENPADIKLKNNYWTITAAYLF